jgi:hypothetical protein
MMTKHLAPAEIHAGLRGTACCELSPGKTAPASTVQTPTADEMNPTSAVSSMDVPSTNPEAASEPLIRASGPTLQAILCVFLI